MLFLRDLILELHNDTLGDLVAYPRRARQSLAVAGGYAQRQLGRSEVGQYRQRRLGTHSRNGSELPERLQFSSISEAEKIYRVLADIQLSKKPDFPAAAYFFQRVHGRAAGVAYPAAFNYREVRLCVD